MFLPSSDKSGRRARIKLILYVSGCFGLFILTMLIIWKISNHYVVVRAEKDIENMLLQHKGVHHYVQRMSHPELYNLKKQKRIPEDLYTPVVFSSSYMVRNMHDFYNKEREKAGLPFLYYKMAAENPRNRVNKASEFERKLIRIFNSKGAPKSYREIQEIDGKKYLYVAVPFLRNEKRCLACHGNYSDAPRQLRQHYKHRGGYDEKVGYIRAIESIRAPFTGQLGFPHIALSSAFIIFVVIIILFIINRRLSFAVKERSGVIEIQKEILKKSEENLRITLNSIGEGVISSDVDGRVVEMNPIAEELTGWMKSEAMGNPVIEIIKIRIGGLSGDDSFIDPFESPRQTNPADRCLCLLARDGTERKIELNRSPILNGEGKTSGVVFVFRDITEQLDLLEKFQQSRKMDAVGQLAGGVAHDFNNMLAGITGSAEILDITIREDDEKSRKYLNIILDSAGKAADLIKKMMVFSRKESAEVKTVNIHRVVEDVIELFKRSIDKSIVIKNNLAAEKQICKGVAAQLENVFINLGINAADAMPGGGVLTFSSRNISLDSDYCRNIAFDLKPGEYISVEVSDTGTGIPDDKLTRIFEPFYTTKPKGRGTGLGLASVYATLCQHGGSITVKSEEGRGSVFNLLLPLTEDTCENQESAEPVNGTGCILVVDDEESIRETASCILESLGFSVLTASDGVKALEVFSANRKNVDLVLLDIIMPNMGGIDCFYELRAIDPEISVLISSGFSDGNNIQDIIDSSNTGFIRKPYSKTDLSLQVAEILRGK